MASLTELDTVQGVMSPEQTVMFDVPSLTLSVVLFACVVGSLVFSAAMFVVQLQAERARMLREALANKARRLRYRDNDERVAAPPIEPNGYHIFLSHCWGSGQAKCVSFASDCWR